MICRYFRSDIGSWPLICTVFAHSGYCRDLGPGERDGSGNIGDIQLFYYNVGATKIQVVDTTTSEVRCVDFGDNPTNGGTIRISPCVDNAPGQNLYITDDLHIAVENGPGQCLDVQAESGLQPIKPYGAVKSVQSYDCSFGNENQVRIRSQAPQLIAHSSFPRYLRRSSFSLSLLRVQLPLPRLWANLAKSDGSRPLRKDLVKPRRESTACRSALQDSLPELSACKSILKNITLQLAHLTC